MDRRRHARTPVNINAMLIGQTTVPKGCRVRNVSQQGMLLQCEPDGRLLTFSKGDKVEIHLTVQYAGEKKSLTIPSSVRHVNEAYIYVEFQHPDLKLVELIESYRVRNWRPRSVMSSRNLPAPGQRRSLTPGQPCRLTHDRCRRKRNPTSDSTMDCSPWYSSFASSPADIFTQPV